MLTRQMGDFLDKESYYAKVQDAAQHIMTVCEAAKAKEEGKEYSKWYEDEEYRGRISSEKDALCNFASDWKDAAQVLETTTQNPDHVDSGIYENCNWKKVLCILAFECWSWDVEGEMERIWNEDDFESSAVAYPTTKGQIGFFPELGRFRLGTKRARSYSANELYGKDGALLQIINLGDAIKLLKMNSLENKLSIVFEGVASVTRGMLFVECRRVYTQCDRPIEEDLEYLRKNFGVKRVD